MSVCVFVYGTLMDPEIMEGVSGTLPQGVEAVLADFGRYKVKGEQFPGIRPAAGERVDGVVYYDVGDEAVDRLDLFEGDLYSREEVSVSVGDQHRSETAMAYIVRPEYHHLLSSSSWDFEEFLRNGKGLFLSGYRGFEEVDRIGNGE